MMNTQTYCINLNTNTSDIESKLYEAAKWCYDNNYKALSCPISEEVYKGFRQHPQQLVGIGEYFPPRVRVFGFDFYVDFTAVGNVVDVPLLEGVVTLTNTLRLQF